MTPAAGDEVALPALGNDNGYSSEKIALFKGWKVEGSDTLYTTYTAGAKDVAFTAVWENVSTANGFAYGDVAVGTTKGNIINNQWDSSNVTSIDATQSYYADGTAAFVRDASGPNWFNVKMSTQAGVDYNVSFALRRVNVENTNNTAQLVVSSQNGSSNGAPLDTIVSFTEVMATANDADFIVYTKNFTATQNEYYLHVKIWDCYGAYVFDEFACYPVGYVAEDKSEKYFTYGEYTAMTVEEQVLYMTDADEETGVVTYTGAATFEGATVTYKVDGGEETDVATFAAAKDYSVEVIWTAGAKKFSKTVTVSVLEKPANVKATFSDDEVSLTDLTLEGIPTTTYTLPTLENTATHAFEGWKLSGSEELVRGETEQVFGLEDVQWNAVWTAIVFTNTAKNSTVADGTAAQFINWIDGGCSYSFDDAMSRTDDGSAALKIIENGKVDDSGNPVNRNAQVKFEFDVVYGVTYQIGFYVRTENYTTTSSFGGGYKVRKGGTAVANISGIDFKNGYLSADTVLDWTLVTFTWTATETGTFDFLLQMHGIKTGALWFDDFFCMEKGAYDEANA